jgi:hypothetical protein
VAKKPSVSSVVRAILSENIDLPADEVIQEARRRGLTATPASVRSSVHNVRSELKKKGTRPAPAAARETRLEAPAAAPAPAPAAGGGGDLAAVLANVALVNRVIDACGGGENVRQAAEAVRSCGGVDPFLQHLDLLLGIRGGNG